MPDVVPPAASKSAFNCPHCGAYSQQYWHSLVGRPWTNDANKEMQFLTAALCNHCGDWSLWYRGNLVHPAVLTAPFAHADMPPDVSGDYNEARAIADRSPRAAAALLRLALQKLLGHLGQANKSLNDAIGALVKQGLDANIQKALDILRITGNNAVHPGELDLRDDRETAEKLFRLLNLIVEQRITQPRIIDELWGKMPEGARDAVNKRDQPPGPPVE